MAHPSKNTPKNLYYVDETNALNAPENRHFFSIVAVVGGDVTLNGGGIFEFVDVSALANDAAAAKYIDPLTGEAFTAKSVAEDADHGDGHYEALSDTDVTVTLAAGQAIFGRFTKVTAASSVKLLVYS